MARNQFRGEPVEGKSDWPSYLGGIASGVAIIGAAVGFFRWRATQRRPRVTVERGVAVTERTNPPDRYHVWGGNRNRRYTLVKLQNLSTKPFQFLRAKLEVPGAEFPRWWSIKNEGVELVPREATHWQLDEEEIGDLRGAKLTVYSHGFERTYNL